MHECSICKKNFRLKKALREHQVEEHNSRDCFLCKHQSDSSEALVQHIRTAHHPSTLEFQRIETAMRGVSEKYRYEVVGLQNNLNSIFNEVIIREVIAFIATKLANHPSYKIKLVLGALYEKSFNQFDRKDLTLSFRSYYDCSSLIIIS